jgi:hypothetical protein
MRHGRVKVGKTCLISRRVHAESISAFLRLDSHLPIVAVGESSEGTRGRAVEGLEWVWAQPQETIAIVTHSLFLLTGMFAPKNTQVEIDEEGVQLFENCECKTMQMTRVRGDTRDTRSDQQKCCIVPSHTHSITSSRMPMEPSTSRW